MSREVSFRKDVFPFIDATLNGSSLLSALLGYPLEILHYLCKNNDINDVESADSACKIALLEEQQYSLAPVTGETLPDVHALYEVVPAIPYYKDFSS